MWAQSRCWWGWDGGGEDDNNKEEEEEIEKAHHHRPTVKGICVRGLFPNSHLNNSEEEEEMEKVNYDPTKPTVVNNSEEEEEMEKVNYDPTKPTVVNKSEEETEIEKVNDDPTIERVPNGRLNPTEADQEIHPNQVRIFGSQNLCHNQKYVDKEPCGKVHVSQANEHHMRHKEHRNRAEISEQELEFLLQNQTKSSHKMHQSPSNGSLNEPYNVHQSQSMENHTQESQNICPKQASKTIDHLSYVLTHQNQTKDNKQEIKEAHHVQTQESCQNVLQKARQPQIKDRQAEHRETKANRQNEYPKTYHLQSKPHHHRPTLDLLKSLSLGWFSVLLLMVLSGVQVRAQDDNTTMTTLSTKSKGWLPAACTASQEWPPVEQTSNKTLFVGFLQTRLGVRKERLGLKIPGVFTYAIEDVNNKSKLPEGYKLRFEWQDTQGVENLGSKFLVDMLCRGVSAVFGPEHTCFVEGTVADGVNLPMLSYACTNERASRLNTFASTNPSELHIIRTAVAALKHNNWTKFSIIYIQDQESTMETLREEARRENMTINHIREYHRDSLTLIFQETKNNTRIYVYLGHRQFLGEMMTAMAMAGVFQSKASRKEYLLLFIEQEEYLPNDWHQYIWGFRTELNQNREKCQEVDLLTLDRQFMVVANRPAESFTLEDRVHEYNERPPFCLGFHESAGYREKPIKDDKHTPNLPTANIYDSVQLYARAVSEIYAAAINNSENITVEEIARDGARIKNHLRNMTYESILGYSMTMNTNASSEGNYSIFFFSDCPPGNEDTFNCSKCLHKIANYYKENSSLEANTEQILILDEPRCGFDGSKCPGKREGYEKPMAISLGVLLILCLFVSTYLYRNWKYEQEIEGLQWRIEQVDLTVNSQVPAGGSRVCDGGGVYSTSSSLTSRELEEGFDYRRLEEISVV